MKSLGAKDETKKGPDDAHVKENGLTSLRLSTEGTIDEKDELARRVAWDAMQKCISAQKTGWDDLQKEKAMGPTQGKAVATLVVGPATLKPYWVKELSTRPTPVDGDDERWRTFVMCRSTGKTVRCSQAAAMVLKKQVVADGKHPFFAPENDNYGPMDRRVFFASAEFMSQGNSIRSKITITHLGLPLESCRSHASSPTHPLPVYV